MKYEEYIKKYQHQIEEAKKFMQTHSFKSIQKFINSEEYKRSLEIIKKRNELVHKNILSEIEAMQEEILKAVYENKKQVK
jgi:predicted patatin/cPLA2 family phospholipase